ncbi:hypothetical protein QQ045_010351 [Rhodiola kirilowii]
MTHNKGTRSDAAQRNAASTRNDFWSRDLLFHPWSIRIVRRSQIRSSMSEDEIELKTAPADFRFPTTNKALFYSLH